MAKQKRNWHSLPAHCPHFGCENPNQPIAELDQADRPSAMRTEFATVVCTSCGKTFQEPVSSLDWVAKAN
jgi:hypothetical protein